MSKKRNVLVLGNFGYANHDLSGQTIKTRAMRTLFEKYGTDFKTDYFDTQIFSEGKRNIFKMVKSLSKCDIVIYLPAHNNLKFIFPIIYLLSKIYKFDIIYSVIGGWLVHFLKNLPLHRKLLKNIKCILAETTTTKIGLENNYHFDNVSVLYNFRLTDFKPPHPSVNTNLKLVFMARIDPMKGLDTIFDFCRWLKDNGNTQNITIDFYGPIDPKVHDKFLETVKSFYFTDYKGCLEPNEIYDAIKDYDILLLPTHYYTEGLPGTIIEAYISGLPVVVTEWEHSHEFVINGSTGVIVSFSDNQQEFNNTITNFSNNPEKIIKMKQNVLLFSEKFKGEYVWKKLLNIL